MCWNVLVLRWTRRISNYICAFVDVRLLIRWQTHWTGTRDHNLTLLCLVHSGSWERVIHRVLVVLGTLLMPITDLTVPTEL